MTTCVSAEEIEAKIERNALARFGIRRFNSAKFENCDNIDIEHLIRHPLESKGIDAAMSAFYAAIPIEDALPPWANDENTI